MKLNYNVIGKERKRMVAVIGEVTEIKPIYTSVASQSYIELSDAKIERSRQCYYVSACT